MLITFKTLEQKTFKIEIDETEKIKSLKEKIAADRGVDQFPPEGQKLIYSGKILDDDKTLSECNIDVKSFVVVMVVKQKPKPAAEKPKESDSSSSSASASAAAAAPASPMVVDSTTPSTTSTQSTTSTTASSESTTSTTSVNTEAAESALLTGSALESSITELMALGYSREQVLLALNRSFHNADRAAEYLLSGNIPDAPADGDGPGGDETGGGDVATVDIGGGVAPGAGGTTDLSFLRNLPQFQLMRTQVQSNPESLPLLLQGIGETNPELLSIINQNQEQFIAILNERGDEAPVGGEQGGAAGGQPFQIQVTANEKEAIDRIVGMGFPEADVIQAFFACDKNEQLAIDFLLSDSFQ